MHARAPLLAYRLGTFMRPHKRRGQQHLSQTTISEFEMRQRARCDIEQQLVDCGGPGCEAAHYMERLMAHVYG